MTVSHSGCHRQMLDNQNKQQPNEPNKPNKLKFKIFLFKFGSFWYKGSATNTTGYSCRPCAIWMFSYLVAYLKQPLNSESETEERDFTQTKSSKKQKRGAT